MIKASAKGGDGKPLLILGLSRKNTEMLLAGRPISVELKAFTGLVGTVLLMAGETEQDIMRELSPLMGPDTRVEGDGL